MEGLVEALQTRGFERDQFGMLAPEQHYEGFLQLAGHPENEGTMESSIIGLLTYVGAMTGLGAAVFSGGGLGLALAALVGAGGAGTVAGLLAAAGFHRAHALSISTEIDEGRLLAWITPRDPSQAQIARDLLTTAGVVEVMECELAEAI
jgi:hypothetical protein